MIVVPSLDCIGREGVQAALVACEVLLMQDNNRIPLLLKREWLRQFPSDAGVYAVFDEHELIYVGETGSIRARMTDFLDSRNHVLRRSIGNTQFKDREGFQEASAHHRFPDHIEESLIEYIENQLTVTAVVVPLGRAEIEEHMAAKYRPRYNAKGKRGSKLHGPTG